LPLVSLVVVWSTTLPVFNSCTVQPARPGSPVSKVPLPFRSLKTWPVIVNGWKSPKFTPVTAPPNAGVRSGGLRLVCTQLACTTSRTRYGPGPRPANW
jgi:hypothetical protein